MLSYPNGTFVPVAIATHGLVGLTFGLLLYERPWAGMLAGMAPDVDLLFPLSMSWPLVHRGLTHSLLVLGIVAVAVAAIDRRTGGAVAAAYASHLLIDATVWPGVPLAWPLIDRRLLVDPGIGGHALPVTIVFWVGCLGVLAVRERDVLAAMAH